MNIKLVQSGKGRVEVNFLWNRAIIVFWDQIWCLQELYVCAVV